MKANLTRFAWLSIAAALLTIGLKTTAYWFTGSVGLLSDALESLVNLVAAIMALAMLTVAARPADEIHAFGYSKAEYFSSGLEGALILLGTGLAISVVASAVNFGVARVLMNAGKEYRSITLEADAHHLMADVWTSAGVVLGVGAVALTGWLRLDPLIALIVAVNILRTGSQLLSRSIRGLLDAALPAAEQDAINQVLRHYESKGIQFHALRTRQAGTRAFISLHVLVPADWTVQRGHDLLEHLERDIRGTVSGAQLFTHLEPQGDPAALEDIALDRKDTAGSKNE
jgi:divalent metal cation (Fe/Co/Zn/Cd) transporter